MVKKLYKHEFLALFRWLLPIDAFCLLFSLLLRLAIEVNSAMSDSIMTDIMVGLLTFTFVISVIGMLFASFWLVVVRFYKHLLSQEGYLTFTIPVTPTTHLVCKLLCGCVMSVLSTLVTVMGLGIILSGFDVNISEVFFDIFGVRFSELFTANTLPAFIGFGVTLLIMLIVSLFYGLLMPYAAMCVGQLSKKNKAAMAVLWYFVFNTAINFVSEIINVIMTFTVYNNMDMFYSMSMGIEEGIVGVLNGYTIMMILPVLTSVVFSIVFFLIARYILNYKLNLE